MVRGFETMRLDMSDTFMVSYDGFGEKQNYGEHFSDMGGPLQAE